jgi:hypothetical protein
VLDEKDEDERTRPLRHGHSLRTPIVLTGRNLMSLVWVFVTPFSFVFLFYCNDDWEGDQHRCGSSLLLILMS